MSSCAQRYAFQILRPQVVLDTFPDDSLVQSHGCEVLAAFTQALAAPDTQVRNS
jgi:hypothetical protein